MNGMEVFKSLLNWTQILVDPCEIPVLPNQDFLLFIKLGCTHD